MGFPDSMAHNMHHGGSMTRASDRPWRAGLGRGSRGQSADPPVLPMGTGLSSPSRSDFDRVALDPLASDPGRDAHLEVYNGPQRFLAPPSTRGLSPAAMPSGRRSPATSKRIATSRRSTSWATPSTRRSTPPMMRSARRLSKSRAANLADRACPAADRQRRLRSLRVLRREDRRGPAQCPTVHQHLHRLPARERAAGSGLRTGRRRRAVGEDVRQAAVGRRRRERHQAQRFEMDLSESGR